MLPAQSLEAALGFLWGAVAHHALNPDQGPHGRQHPPGSPPKNGGVSGDSGDRRFLNRLITHCALVSFSAGSAGNQFTPDFMSNIPIAFYVLGSLFTLYIVAATWRSRDAPSHLRSELRPARSRSVSVDRRLSHWWRARQRSKKLT
jgi:hypothetical protein